MTNKCIGKAPCPIGKLCNPDTGRCKKIPVKKSVRKSRAKKSIKKSIKKSVNDKCRGKAPCPIGKLCNPDTGRCKKIPVKKSVKSRVKKSVRKSRAKKSIKKSVNDKCRGKAPCPIGKLCNPDTGRCKKIPVKKSVKSRAKKSVKKSVKSRAKKSVKKSVKSRAKKSVKKRVKKSVKEDSVIWIASTVENPYEERPLGSEIEKYINDNYIITKTLGKGSNGTVYEFMDGIYPKALKVMDISILGLDPLFSKLSVRREFDLNKIFSNLDIAPKVYNLRIVGINNINYMLIEMEKVEGMLFDFLQKMQSEKTITNITNQLLSIFEKYHKAGYAHGDPHLHNIGYRRLPDGSLKLYLIDFGWACCLTMKVPSILSDKLQLLRTIVNPAFGNQQKIPLSNFTTMVDILLRDLDPMVKKSPEFRKYGVNSLLDLNSSSLSKFITEYFDQQNDIYQRDFFFKDLINLGSR